MSLKRTGDGDGLLERCFRNSFVVMMYSHVVILTDIKVKEQSIENMAR